MGTVGSKGKYNINDGTVKPGPADGDGQIKPVVSADRRFSMAAMTINLNFQLNSYFFVRIHC